MSSSSEGPLPPLTSSEEVARLVKNVWKRRLIFQSP